MFEVLVSRNYDKMTLNKFLKETWSTINKGASRNGIVSCHFSDSFHPQFLLTNLVLRAYIMQTYPTLIPKIYTNSYCTPLHYQTYQSYPKIKINSNEFGNLILNMSWGEHSYYICVYAHVNIIHTLARFTKKHHQNHRQEYSHSFFLIIILSSTKLFIHS